MLSAAKHLLPPTLNAGCPVLAGFAMAGLPITFPAGAGSPQIRALRTLPNKNAAPQGAAPKTRNLNPTSNNPR